MLMMKDTVEFEFLRAYVADNFISPQTRDGFSLLIGIPFA